MNIDFTNRMKKGITVLLAVFVSGCASGTISMKEDNMAKRLAETPYVNMLTDKRLESNTPQNNIQVFYRIWTMMNKPVGIQNWELSFMIGEGSEPKDKYLSIAEITHYQLPGNDRRAVGILRKIASSLGGNAIVDVRKSPALDKAFLPAKILGYRYEAEVVRLE